MQFPQNSNGEGQYDVTAADVAALVNGTIRGDPLLKLSGFASVREACAGELTFADNPEHMAAAEGTAASAILINQSSRASMKTLISVANTRVAMATLLQHYFPQPKPPEGIHPSAVIDASAQIEPDSYIGPHCVIESGVRIGAGCVIMGGNHIRHNCILGKQVVLHPNVVLYPGSRLGNRVTIHAGTVIGSDGYGYVFDRDHHRKIPQLGCVVIEDDVEIGANTAIDRSTFDQTLIGQGTKIDNLVHIAHNVEFGRHCLIMGQCGFAGGTRIGDFATIASQSGVAGHLELGDRIVVGAKSGVMRDIPTGETVLGLPARPAGQTKRQWVAQQHLPDMAKRLRAVEGQLAARRT